MKVDMEQSLSRSVSRQPSIQDAENIKKMVQQASKSTRVAPMPVTPKNASNQMEDINLLPEEDEEKAPT
ncbi:hypothetical protein COB52_05165 [Candidatus Kaiserbacteria bacterium]|nr:MAG: hypothetical protein COB52_05165 [Candidatus Kaiserbacteria bacterium]